ncbi:hypothetical protein FACS189421_08260 [Bacteroidia bacterium]|nr:hypothetical protein FACS189421_08260 [Bacteroidia bacterium]
MLILLAYILLWLPPVQQKIKDIALTEIMKKTHNQMSIGELHFRPFNHIQLTDVYANDLRGDTLLYVEKLSAGFNLFKLLDKQLLIQSVDLENFVANIQKDSLNSDFNFQFLIDAFVGGTIEFTASDFLPAGAAPGVNWVIPSGSASIAAIKSSTVTTCIVEGLTEGTATLTVTSLDNNVTKTVTIDVQPVSLQSFALSGAPLNLTTNGAAGTVTANTFVGTDGKAFPGSVTVNWAVTNGTENPSGVVKTGTTYTVTPGSSAATWTVTPSAGGFTADPFTVTITAWTGSTVPDAAKDYNISPNTNNSAGTDGSMAKDWGSAANDAGSGNYWTSYPATGATPSSGGTNLMVSNKVYSNANEVSSPNASADKQNAAQSLSALSDGITWADAVKKCVNLTEGGFDDWYLPNSMELQVLYDNAYLGYSAIGSRVYVYYWSSTEGSATYAWYRIFDSSSTNTINGNKTNDSNSYNTWVARCVRRTN